MWDWSIIVSDVTRLLGAIDQGDPKAAQELLPLVYEELRRLAAHKMARESPGQTLQATALVHEAWLRLGADARANWKNRTHFFGAAAEAMRRILVERARRRRVLEKGGFGEKTELDESNIVLAAPDEELLAVHEELDRLAAEDSAAAGLVKLRYFVGMTMPEAAEAMGLPLRSAERLWTFARAWLRQALGG
jgi:RNA polymerase sigma factor (TIGR02999 family)